MNGYKIPRKDPNSNDGYYQKYDRIGGNRSSNLKLINELKQHAIMGSSEIDNQAKVRNGMDDASSGSSSKFIGNAGIYEFKARALGAISETRDRPRLNEHNALKLPDWRYDPPSSSSKVNIMEPKGQKAAIDLAMRLKKLELAATHKMDSGFIDELDDIVLPNDDEEGVTEVKALPPRPPIELKLKEHQPSSSASISRSNESGHHQFDDDSLDADDSIGFKPMSKKQLDRPQPPLPVESPKYGESPSILATGKHNADSKASQYDSHHMPSETIRKTDHRKSRYNVQIARASADPETVRKCLITDHFFLDYYHDLLTYLYNRKQRLLMLKEDMRAEGLSADEQQRQLRLHFTKESAYLRKRRCRTNIAQFNVLVQIGQGGYGQVYLARKKDTGEVCALKKMSKKLLHKMNEVQHVITERNVLTQTNTPWLVRLFYAFQDIENVYLAMEYVPGGDLRTLLNNSGILREQDARFYVAEMFLAINELHRIGAIHRDLKPENFLIDTAGHLKLTDFGLSKGQISQARVESLRNKLESPGTSKLIHYSSIEKRAFYQRLRVHNQQHTRAFSLVGSPDYMAPEILVHSHHSARGSVYAPGYDYLVDYWSLGCIMFEFLAGYPPFTGESPDDVWVNVYHWQEVLERPMYEGVDVEFNLSNPAWDLIMHLVTHRHMRLSSLKDVQAHEWFAPMNERLQGYQSAIRRRAVNPQRSNISAQSISGISSNVHGPIVIGSSSLTVDPWVHLRTLPRGIVDPPFIPQLASELDHCHFDDFSNPEALNIYKEVYDKMERLNADADEQTQADSGATGKGLSARSSFVGFTFRHKNAVDWSRIEQSIQPSSGNGNQIHGSHAHDCELDISSGNNESKQSNYLKRFQVRLNRHSNE